MKRVLLRERILKRVRGIFKQSKTGRHPTGQDLIFAMRASAIISKADLLRETPLPALRSLSRRERNKFVDNAVLSDPVGKKLYFFVFEKNTLLPQYLRSKSFVKSARLRWQTEKETFKKELIALSDAETRKHLKQASEQEWFETFFQVQIVFEEREKASEALARMQGRKLKENEYNEWAERLRE